MAMNRSWIGNQDGNNDASNPDNWNPLGAPQPGDTLFINGTLSMDISGNDLQGDFLVTTLPRVQPTLNLTYNALVKYRSVAGMDSTTVNIDGNGTLDALLRPDSQLGAGSGITVNLSDAHNSHLFGTFSTVGGGLTISGGEHTQYINNSANVLSGTNVTIDTRVVGSGSFAVSATAVRTSNGSHLFSGNIRFAHFVSEEQTVSLAGLNDGSGHPRPNATALIDNPNEFHGTLDLHDLSSSSLLGLVGAATWSYAKDILSVFDTKGKTIDQLHVISDGSASVHGLSVGGSSSSGFVSIAPGSDFHGSLV